VRRLLVASILIGLAAPLLSPALAGASGTGGASYEPLPNRARPVNPGSIPGETGGAGYVPAAKRHAAETPAGEVPGGIDKDLRSATDHRFPVLGEHSFGGDDAGFGARRPGHRHQGQDIIARRGTPVVAPRGGTVSYRAFQARGAGYYLVLDAVDEPYSYVFMHLRRGSIEVRVGDRVRTGQQLAQVGSTGTASGPHLHFEIWSGGWYKDGAPLDPLPYLQVWDAIS
jgi:murein DD-endopeptidase MepM/ murein hydrolase activator NlpD